MPVEVVVARAEPCATRSRRRDRSKRCSPSTSARGDGRIVEILIREGQEVEQERRSSRWTMPSSGTGRTARGAARSGAAGAGARQRPGAAKRLSAADLEKAEAEARGAQAQYDLQRIRLERTTVRAPFAGVVGQRYVSLGDYVTNTTKLASLHTVNPQRASFQVPERFAAPLPRQAVTFRVAAIAVATSSAGGLRGPNRAVARPTILVKARVPNPSACCSPGCSSRPGSLRPCVQRRRIPRTRSCRPRARTPPGSWLTGRLTVGR